MLLILQNHIYLDQKSLRFTSSFIFFCPGGSLFLTSWIYTADESTEIPRAGELYSNRLVSPLASARSAVGQHHFHREDTWTGGDGSFTPIHYCGFLKLMLRP